MNLFFNNFVDICGLLLSLLIPNKQNHIAHNTGHNTLLTPLSLFNQTTQYYYYGCVT